MFRKLFLSLFFSLPLYSSQTPSPIGERTLSAPNGQILREIFTESGDANVYICDCSTWPQDENGRIPELNIRLELRSDYRLASYIFQNIPLKATLMDVQNVLLGKQLDRSLCFLDDNVVFDPSVPLNSSQIKSESLIYAISSQQYFTIPNDPEKSKRMKDRLRVDWERNGARINSTRKMIKRQEDLDREAAKLMDLRFTQRESSPTAWRRYLSVFQKEKEMNNHTAPCILHFPNETPYTDSKPDEISTEPLPDAWDSE